MISVHNIEDINIIKRKTLVTVGMFDGVHLGHQYLLKTLRTIAASRSMMPFVVTFDRHPRQVIDMAYIPQMLCTGAERLRKLEECGVDEVAVVTFDKSTASMSACDFARTFLCGNLNMGGLLLGYDNQFGSRKTNDFDDLPRLGEELGFEVFRDKAVNVGGVEVSSTKIRRYLLSGDVHKAATMLGEPYTLEGQVVRGRHVGTGIGFPTANVCVDGLGKILPKPGVYFLKAELDGNVYAAMANLGAQPTFHQDKTVLEVHLLDFDGDIYGSMLRVGFMYRIRDIETFPSREALINQLQRDRQDAILFKNSLL